MNDGLEEWVPRVYRFALRLSNDPHVAEDLTQEAFLRAWRRRAGLREPRALRVWMFRIVANVWHDQTRRARSPVARAGPLQDVVTWISRQPDRLASGREELARAFQAMAELPARQREVVYLSACEGLSSTEIAEILGISRESAKASLSLGRKRIRELLDHPAPLP